MHNKTECLSYCGGAREKQKVLIAAELMQTFLPRMLVQILKLSRSTFYYHLKQNRRDKYFYEKEKIKEPFESNKGRYGYRRITALLRQKHPVKSQNGIKADEKLANPRGNTRK